MEEQHIPMEKRAKGKSNVFKFVTIRNPQSASPASKQVKFIYHPDIAKNQFTKTVNVGSSNPRRKALATDNNQKTSADFKPLSSVEAVSLIYLHFQIGYLEIEILSM